MSKEYYKLFDIPAPTLRANGVEDAVASVEMKKECFIRNLFVSHLNTIKEMTTKMKEECFIQNLFPSHLNTIKEMTISIIL